MKKTILLILFSCCWAVSLLAWSFDQNKQYYLRSDYAQGFVALSSAQGQTGYVLRQQTSGSPTADAYWYINASGSGYTLRNAQTGQYLSWTNDYDNLRNLALASTLSGDEQRWILESTNGAVLIRSVAHPTYCLNLRSSTLQIALWNYNSVQANSLFHIYDSAGNEVKETTEPTDPSEPTDPEPEPEPTVNYLVYGPKLYYLRHSNNSVSVLPKDYITRHTYSGSRFTATLVNGSELLMKGILQIDSILPADAPKFQSFKFNNKFNHQVFQDVIAEDATQDNIRLTVAGIGRWLCASFQLADPATEVWANGKRQRSKVSRLSFATPVTYKLTHPAWKMLLLRQESDNSLHLDTVPYARQQTVSVDFLATQSPNNNTVPRIDITLSNSSPWGSTNWIGMNGKSTYMDATIQIQGGGLFPDLAQMPIQIKGRGNSSWTHAYQSKNPYHFKFAEKQKPLGMKAGKHWILLANKMKGSMTTNAIGHKIASMTGAAAYNHIVPVELYINGSYRGSYNLTERVGFSNNSVDLTDESSAAMLELDTYTDEPIYRSNAYYVSTKIHIPDANDVTTLTNEQIIEDFNQMTRVLKQGGDAYTKLVDVPYLVSYLSAYQLMDNRELQHPKSVFLYSENVTDQPNAEGIDETPWVFGPVWDCDWAFGYEGTNTYFINAAELDFFSNLGSSARFWYDLRKSSSLVDSTYYALFHTLKENNYAQEMKDYVQDYYNFASPSLEHNYYNDTYNIDWSDYASVTTNSKKWLEQRFNYVLSRLKVYDVSANQASVYQEGRNMMGDVNDDGRISTADVVTLLNALLGQSNETYYAARADVDSNGRISIGDVVQLCNMVLEQPRNARLHLHTPMADIALHAGATTLSVENGGLLPLRLEVAEGQYSGLQMDLRLPAGVEPDGIRLPASMSNFTARTSLLQDGTYRLMLYADGSVHIPQGQQTLQLRLVASQATEGRIHLNAISATTRLGEEERLPSLSSRIVANDGQTTAIERVQDIKGTHPGYDLSGRRVDTTQRGVYILNGKKYVK